MIPRVKSQRVQDIQENDTISSVRFQNRNINAIAFTTGVHLV